MMRLTGLAVAMLAALLGGGVLAQPIPQGALLKQTDAALAHWRASLKAHGWVGLQAEVADCFTALDAKPTQAKAAYCTALDHYTLLDTLSFPEALRPPYFGANTVFARLDKAVAASTPAADRAAFGRALLMSFDESIRKPGAN
jgi:hypothetical protein